MRRCGKFVRLSACPDPRHPDKQMRALLQRVRRASVRVDGEELASISRGLLILLGVGQADTRKQAAYLAEKTAHLRIFDDPMGKTNLSILDVKGEAIVVSQFTLYADATKGRRPSFADAAAPEIAAPLVQQFAELLRGQGVATQEGAFGRHMLVEIQNDGPVTVWLDRS